MLDTRRFILLLIPLIFLVACAPSPVGQDLVGTSWKLIRFFDGNSQVGEAIGSHVITLTFEDNGQAGGSGGCNSFGAKYRAESSNGFIAFSELVSTLMACTTTGIMDVEQTYFAALNAADHYTVDLNAKTLTVTGGGYTLVFGRTSGDS